MRSLTPRTIVIASILALAPLAGARAAPPSDAGPIPADSLQGPRVTALVDQAGGIRQDIADALRAREINAMQAHRLDMRAAGIEHEAERVAAVDHGRIPSPRYQQLLRRLDDVGLHLPDYAPSGSSDTSRLVG